ncbi:response regulator [Geomonas sp. Red276]
MERGNVLVVDDDDHFRKLLKCVIEQEEVGVDAASNGLEALGMLKKGGYGLMITDLNMPGLNGLELSEEAKRLYPKLRIVMITGDASFVVEREASRIGISPVLRKPCRPEDILSIVWWYSRKARVPRGLPLHH